MLCSIQASTFSKASKAVPQTEATGPMEVEGTGKFPPRGAVFDAAAEIDIDHKYANGEG
ncbi:MAG: hypothetical protein QGG71_16095 [Pirellulaceae bacterium]|nr:hypothetical protein [Pirellulaceae bacterium]